MLDCVCKNGLSTYVFAQTTDNFFEVSFNVLYRAMDRKRKMGYALVDGSH